MKKEMNMPKKSLSLRDKKIDLYIQKKGPKAAGHKSSPLIAANLHFMIPPFVPAQVAAELEDVLQATVLTCVQAARVVLACAGSQGNTKRGDPTVPAAERDFGQAMNNGWLPKGTRPYENITLEKLSLLMMKAFNIRGGMVYAILPGPRCAFRTMLGRCFIEGPSDPAAAVSGIRFLQILEKVINAQQNALHKL
jgi:hypothetical protein